MELICNLTFTNDEWPVCKDHHLKAFTLMHHLQLQWTEGKTWCPSSDLWGLCNTCSE